MILTFGQTDLVIIVDQDLYKKQSDQGLHYLPYPAASF